MFSMASSSVLTALQGGQLWRGQPQGKAQRAPVLSSGLFALDAALTLGGLPLGAVTEIRATPGQGALSLAMHACAHVLRAPHQRAAVVDGPGTLHGPAVLEAGVPPGRLWCVRPKDPSRTVPLALRLIRSGAFRLVVVDHALWPPSSQPELQVRKLAVAAQESQGAVMLLCGTWADALPLPLPGALRLRMQRTSRHRVNIQVEKQRGSSLQQNVTVAWPFVDNTTPVALDHPPRAGGE